MTYSANSEAKRLIELMYAPEARLVSQIPQRCPQQSPERRLKTTRTEGPSKSMPPNDRKCRYSAYPAKEMLTGWFVDEPLAGRKRTVTAGSPASPRDLNPRPIRGQRIVSKIPQRKNVYDLQPYSKNKIPIIKVPMSRKPAPKQVNARKSPVCTIQTTNKLFDQDKANNNSALTYYCPDTGNSDGSRNDTHMDGDYEKCEELQQKVGILEQRELEEAITEESNAEKSCAEEVQVNENYNSNLELLDYWTKKLDSYLNLKEDLQNKQKEIMQLYASLRDTYNKMSKLGQQVELPSAHDLRVLNVGNLTPDELAVVCSRPEAPDQISVTKQNMNALFDVNKLYKTQENIITACHHTLEKRKEIIDWLKSLLDNENKGIRMASLICKIEEFDAENDVLNNTLKSTKSAFLKDINEVSDVLRMGVSDTMSLQLKNEELTYEISELNSQNTDLRKQLLSNSCNKSRGNKSRVEGLEKELKEEKCKKAIIRERLIRAENQVKTSAERTAQLESIIAKARSEAWNLKRTVSELQKQNLNLQTDFDEELSKLTKSVQENTSHLEKIGDAREKLQQEKEELENQLKELTDHYSKLLEDMQNDVKTALDKITENEAELEKERQEKSKLQERIDSLSKDVEEWEIRYKQLSADLEERENDLHKALNLQSEFDEDLKQGLDKAKIEAEEYKNQLVQQNETVEELERVLKDNLKLIDDLNNEVGLKTKQIAEMEHQQALLDEKLQEGETKMESYADQMLCLKNNLNKIKEELGDFESINELQDKIRELQDNVEHLTKDNNLLSEILERKEYEIAQELDKCKEHVQTIEIKNNIIKELSDKEFENANTIDCLRNELAQISEGKEVYKVKVVEKDAEIIALYTNVEKRKQQIAQLEKIVYTLEDQTQQANCQREKDRELIEELEHKITLYEEHLGSALKNSQDPVEHVDSLIRLFEDELGSPMNQLDTDSDFTSQRQSMQRGKTGKKIEKYVKEIRGHSPYQCHTKGNISQADHDDVPAKIVTANFVKKTYIPDKLQREQVERNGDHTKSYASSSESIMKNKNDLSEFLLSNKHFMSKHQDNHRYRNEKQNKLLKLACHKI